ncbi:hypothetical protein ACHHYP_11706 [Achlya hypogyna]|uniref:Uncharacterized protein n=1 Tax=Achlya hypogyna TaxID=1202772 RepID=A0A1V9YII8_ACHHY|nr:hypothetical protein ACHHYP_11706 [Achlya hypogyna]
MASAPSKSIKEIQVPLDANVVGTTSLGICMDSLTTSVLSGVMNVAIGAAMPVVAFKLDVLAASASVQLYARSDPENLPPSLVLRTQFPTLLLGQPVTQSPSSAVHADALRALLASVEEELAANAARGCIAVERVESLAELLHALSCRVEAPADAAALFACGLRLALLEAALACCGAQTRAAIARWLPQLCLEDVAAAVRLEALRHILPREDLVKAHGVALVRSLYWIHKPLYQTADVSAQLCLDQLSLSLAACPVLVVLARVTPLYVPEVVLKLLSAADLCAMNDPLSEAAFVAEPLDAVAAAGPRDALVRFALSPQGRPALPVLVRFGSRWHRLVTDVVRTGLLVEEPLLLLPGAYPRLERLLNKGAVAFRATAAGRQVLEDALSTEDEAHQVHFWNQLHQLVVAEFERGDAFKALRMASTMKTWYPDDYLRMGTQAFVTDTLLPHLQRTAFPAAYDAAALAAFGIHFRAMHEVKLLFPDEAEKHLQLSAQLDAFARAKLLDVARTDGQVAARAWLAVYGLQALEPLLEEADAAPPLATPVDGAWASAVGVMDGALAPASLDDIVVATDKV